MNERFHNKVPSIERQVRIASGLLVLTGIALAYAVFPPFIWIAVVAALGMVLSGLTDSCALGQMIKEMPWNK
jgi:amino acid transporter